MADASVKTKVGLVGEDKKGLEILVLLLRDVRTEVKILIDPSLAVFPFQGRELGPTLAEKVQCPLSRKIEDLALFPDLDVIVDLDSSPGAREKIEKAAPPGSYIVSGKTALLLWHLRRTRLTREIGEFQKSLCDSAFMVDRVKPVIENLDPGRYRTDLFRIFLEMVLLGTDGEQARLAFPKSSGESPIEHPPEKSSSSRVARQASISLGVPLSCESVELGQVWIERSFGRAPFSAGDVGFISSLSSLFVGYLQKNAHLEDVNFLLKLDPMRKEIRKLFGATSSSWVSKLHGALEVLSRVFDLSQGDLYLLDPASGALVLQASTGPLKNWEGQIRVDKGAFADVWTHREGLFLSEGGGPSNSGWQEVYFGLRGRDREIGILFMKRHARRSGEGESERLFREAVQFFGEQIEQELTQQLASETLVRLSTLNERGLNLLTLRDVDQIASVSLTSTGLLIKAHAIILRLHEDGVWWVAGSLGLENLPEAQMILDFDEILVSERVIPGGTSLILNDLSSLQKLPPRFPYRNLICLPLRQQDEWVGILSLYDRLSSNPLVPSGFTEEDLEILSKYSAYLSRALYQARKIENLENLPGTDPLSGFKNEKYFQARLSEELERAARHGRELGVVFVEIDRFQDVVSCFEAGTVKELVRVVGKMIFETFRNVDIIAKLTDNLFGVILPDTGKGLKEGIARLEKNMFRFGFKTQRGELVPIRFRYGWSYFPDMATNHEDLVRLASNMKAAQKPRP